MKSRSTSKYSIQLSKRTLQFFNIHNSKTYSFTSSVLLLVWTYYPSNATTSTTTDENAVSRSYIIKHSPAWHSFAIANDINKREKLKKALRDALKSVVTDERKSDIATTRSSSTTSSDAVENPSSSLSRITHAAKLLTEFQQIHKLSETVKRTLTEYNTAKSDLSQSIKDNSGVNMLKQFLVGRTKRTNVPHVDLTLGEVKPMQLKRMILDKPHYLKHTDKISVLAEPLAGDKVGLEFISVDPKTSTLDRAQKAFKAANILLDYVGSKRRDSTEHVDGLIETLRNDIDGIYKGTNENEKKKKSLLASKANNLFIDKPDNVKQVTAAKKETIELNENKDSKTNNGNNVKNEINRVQKNESAADKEIEQEKKDTLKKDNDISSKERNPVPASTKRSGENEISANAEEMLHNTLKQQETLRTLKEAKLARQKYEIARHELAQKVKELYKMANDYEKEETDNQVLEVKNDHIPKAYNSSQPLPEDNVNVPHTKRDDAHPGMALSGVSNHPVKGISTATSTDDGEHKAFTMGAIDKKEHQVDVDSVSTHEKQSVKMTSDSKTLLGAVPAKRKTVDDTTLPSNIKLDELKDEVGKNMKSQEESLKVIAQAIKEDMKDIANVNKKKKMVAEAMTTSGGNKKDKQSTDKLDEYLTKALSDIMGPDSVAGSESGKAAEEKQAEKAVDNKNTKEDNMKIIAEAMKSSGNDLPLPLISTKGDYNILLFKTRSLMMI